MSASAETRTGVRIDPRTQIGAVRLTVSDLGRSQTFYERALGLPASESDDGTVAFGPAGERPLVELRGDSSAPRARPPGDRALPPRRARSVTAGSGLRPMPDAIPRTWIMTLQDRAIGRKLQRRTIEAIGGVQTLIEIDSCHMVMVSEPEQLAEILVGRCGLYV